MYSIFCQRRRQLPRRRAYQFLSKLIARFHQLSTLCALSFLRVQSSFVFHVRTQLRVNATHSTCSWSVELREQVIPREWSHTRKGVCDPKNCKRARNRPKRKNEQRSRDAIRQILARE